MKPRGSQIAVIFLFLLYLIVAAVLVVIYILNLNGLTENDSDSRSWHGILMVAGIICLGFALFMFRLFRGFRTRAVKYFHFLFHTIALVLFIVGCFVGNHQRPKSVTTDDKKSHTTTSAHIYGGYHFVGCFAVQYIVALFIFIYLYENKKNRMYFAPFHDIIGIWLFLCCAACFLSGVNYLYEVHMGSKSDDIPLMMQILLLSSYAFFLLVLGVILSPYLEWELVGPL